MDEYVVLHVELLFSYTFSFKLKLTIESGSCIMDQGNHMHACMHACAGILVYLPNCCYWSWYVTDLGGQFNSLAR